MTPEVSPPTLLAEIRHLIDGARQRVAGVINAELTLLYWQIGRRISAEVLRGQRTEYGGEVLKKLAEALTREYGQGWGERQLRYCVRVAEAFPDEEILNTLCSELSWSHLRTLMLIDDPLKREFYTGLCRHERWSVRRLQERINSLLFRAHRHLPQARRDHPTRPGGAARRGAPLGRPCVPRSVRAGFPGPCGRYSEKDLESAILAELQRVIVELGSDFAFLARQKRITVDDRDYYIDLLFYHRRLKCLVPST